MTKRIELSNYYVAYFDVLGYEEHFRKSGEDVQEFIGEFCSAIDDTIAVINNMLSGDCKIYKVLLFEKFLL
jgi:hypothetical protein